MISSMSIHIQMQCMHCSSPIFAVKWVSAFAFDIDCTDRMVGIINIHQLIFHFVWNDAIKWKPFVRKAERQTRRGSYSGYAFTIQTLRCTFIHPWSDEKKLFMFNNWTTLAILWLNVYHFHFQSVCILMIK